MDVIIEKSGINYLAQIKTAKAAKLINEYYDISKKKGEYMRFSERAYADFIQTCDIGHLKVEEKR